MPFHYFGLAAGASQNLAVSFSLINIFLSALLCTQDERVLFLTLWSLKVGRITKGLLKSLQL
jgi:hypothetical protein